MAPDNPLSSPSFRSSQPFGPSAGAADAPAGGSTQALHPAPAASIPGVSDTSAAKRAIMPATADTPAAAGTAGPVTGTPAGSQRHPSRPSGSADQPDRATGRDWYGRSQFPDDSDDDYLEDDEAGPLDEDAAIATLPPLTDEDRALINKLVHSMRLLDVGISSQAAHEATGSAPVPFPEVAKAGSTDPAPFAPRTTTIPPAVRQPRPATPEDEEAIPMLTDVVNVQRYHPDQLPRSFADVDWSELAGQVRENVLERLLRRGDILLDGQMNHALAPVISRAVETMTRDVHDTLNRLIRDIVARAVNEEITRLHAEMARQNRDV